MRRPDIHRLIDFHAFLNRFAEVERVIFLKRNDKVVPESDTEHSYNLAMMAWLLSQHFPELDQSKVVKLALVHDLVEVHAGDTFIFAEQSMLDSKKERETKALRQISKEWPDFPAMLGSIREYEALKSPEARFVYALDKLIPMITVYLSDGITWKEKRLTLEQLHAEKMQKMKVAPDVLKYWEDLYELLLRQPELFEPVTI